MDTIISIRAAQFWVKNYRELLAMNEAALERMQALVTASTRPPEDYQQDLQLVMSGIERASDGLRYWEDLVGTVAADDRSS